MEEIVFLDREGLLADIRKPGVEHRWIEYPTTAPEQVVDRLQNATAAIIDRVSLEEAHLAQLPRLKFIAVAATGVDSVDLEGCRKRGIAVSNVRNWSRSVPEHVFALILALRRNLLGYHGALRQGAWQQAENYTLLLDPLPLSLHGMTLGIIGYGTLGKGVARLAEAFGMEVLVAERKGAPCIREGRRAFSEVVERSSVLVILCPLTDDTRALIGEKELARMPRHALLINCGRGGIVDENALAKALRDGVIAGAGLDVLAEEPPRPENPLLALQGDNLIVTPHVAWASEQSMQALADQVIENVEAFFAGEPRNRVA